MARRIHVPLLSVGEITLDDAQAHHARDVLRLEDGAHVEVFDGSGAVGAGLVRWNAPGPRVEVTTLTPAPHRSGLRLTIAAAVPKGNRADWMIEKLSELGVEVFIPLAADRSVVLPEGRSKYERWVRIATEAAKQSRRHGVMRIAPLTPLPKVLTDDLARGELWSLSTEPGAVPLDVSAATRVPAITALIGPEGGWTDREIQSFKAAQIRRISIGQNILRIETAAVAVAAMCMALSPPPPPT